MPDDDRIQKAFGLLRELAECWRGDWSDFDGRTLRHQINDWVAWAGSDATEEDFRESHGLCLLGNGHWEQHCEDYDK